MPHNISIIIPSAPYASTDDKTLVSALPTGLRTSTSGTLTARPLGTAVPATATPSPSISERRRGFQLPSISTPDYGTASFTVNVAPIQRILSMSEKEKLKRDGEGAHAGPKGYIQPHVSNVPRRIIGNRKGV
jgi:hypothetical protein